MAIASEIAATVRRIVAVLVCRPSLAFALAGVCLFACNPASLAPRRSSLSQGIVQEKELIIRDLSAVEDPNRTSDPCASGLATWSFGALMSRIAAQAGADDAPAFVLRWLGTWDVEQDVNGFIVPIQRMDGVITSRWLRESGGDALDLSRAPFRLLAIVNRMDLRKVDPDGNPIDAGELRFVFGAVNTTCDKIPLEIILEFRQDAQSADDVAAWAERWHALGSLPFGVELNAALQDLTDRITLLNQLRTNDNAASFPDWEQRTYVVAEGDLRLAPLDQTPDASLEGSQALADYVNANEEQIIADQHVVPAEMRGGAIPTDLAWSGTGMSDPFEARHHFALASCNGCHGDETATALVHVDNRNRYFMSDLSNYLTGRVMPILDTMGRPRYFNELQRRADDLQSLLANGGALPAPRLNRAH